MHNCIIMGSGRSGTSMIAGTLAQAGYFMGENLYPPRDSNPKGFYEDPEVNNINETLLSSVLPKRPPILGKWFFRDRPKYSQYWLARLPVSVKIQTNSRVDSRIQGIISKEPYCLKDPRFSYTLPVWRQFLKNEVYICIFRDPSSTVASILKECRSMDYLRDLSIDYFDALEVWNLMYSHILDIHQHKGCWLFIHYNQIIDGNGLDKLEAFTGAKVDRSFPDSNLRRTISNSPMTEYVKRTYKKLCDLASYDDFSE
jgi:hypothetical protein